MAFLQTWTFCCEHRWWFGISKPEKPIYDRTHNFDAYVFLFCVTNNMNSEAWNMFRAWYGYRMMFGQGVPLPLDENKIPKFKRPQMSPSQRGFAAVNVKTVMRSIPEEGYWLFAFAAAMVARGALPHPFALSLAEPEITKMQRAYQQYLQHDFDEELANLEAMGDLQLQAFEVDGNKTRLITMFANGTISPVAVMMYDTKVAKVDYSCLEQTGGMVSKRLLRVIRMCLQLEQRDNLSLAVKMMQKRLI